MAPVARVTIHHEGAGSPTDNPRGAQHGYSYWIGASYWTRLRSPQESWATLNYNGVSLDICLSGNRENYPVTDRDVEMIRQVCADARNRDEVVDQPAVLAHKYSPGSQTVCPGEKTMDRWEEIVAVCRVPPAPVLATKVKPMYEHPLGPIVAVWTDQDAGTPASLRGKPGAKGRVLAAVAADGDVYAWGVPYRKWETQQVDFAGRSAARIGPAKNGPDGRYTITATSGETYTP
jgi:hypothetical protein